MRDFLDDLNTQNDQHLLTIENLKEQLAQRDREVKVPEGPVIESLREKLAMIDRQLEIQIGTNKIISQRLIASSDRCRDEKLKLEQLHNKRIEELERKHESEMDEAKQFFNEETEKVERNHELVTERLESSQKAIYELKSLLKIAELGREDALQQASEASAKLLQFQENMAFRGPTK